jgi:multiple sugar transport system substrate-binding protein
MKSLKLCTIIVLAAVLLFCSFIVFAGGAQEAKAKKTEITLYTKAGLWIGFIRDSRIIEDFQERMLKEKGIEVVVNTQTAPHEGYGTKQVTDMAAGSAGDVLWVDSENGAMYRETEMLLDLTPFVKKWPDWKHIYPSLQKMYEWDGKYWAIANDAATLMIYHRKDLFKKAGLALPWQPETWDDVIEAGLKLKSALPELDIIMEPYYEHQLPVYSDGGNIFDAKDGKWVKNSKSIHYMFQLYHDIFFKYELTPKEFKLEKWDDRKMFADATLPMMIDGTWCYSEKWGPNSSRPIEDRPNIVGYAHTPRSKRVGATTPHGKYPNALRDWAWAINAECKEPELAFELIKEILKPKHNAKWGLDTAHLIARDDALIGDYAADPFMKWATSCLEYAVPKPFSPDFKRYNDSLKEVLDNYLVELGKSADESVKRFGELLTEKIGADKLKDM